MVSREFSLFAFSPYFFPCENLLFFDPKPLKRLYAFRGSIGKVVYRGFWLNLPGILAQPNGFTGDYGSTEWIYRGLWLNNVLRSACQSHS